jgi:K+-transporting ATPase A subunit
VRNLKPDAANVVVKYFDVLGPFLGSMRPGSHSPALSAAATQLSPFGPALSPIAIKQNGHQQRRVFQINPAHPRENSMPLSSTLKVLTILLISAADWWAIEMER